MKKELFTEIEIPGGIEASLEDGVLKIKGPKGESQRKFRLGKLNFEIKDNKISLGHEKATKSEKKIINTMVAHINNMLKGAQEGFEYTLKVCSSHFPMTVTLESDNKKAIVKNFLGEKIPREVSIPSGADVKIDKEIITINSVDKEIAGQTAANFERSTKVRNRDRRIFQDGIFIINKAGREM